MKALVVGGNGRVGGALIKQLKIQGHEAAVFSSKDDRSTFVDRVKQVDIVFLAIPSSKSEAACAYILEVLAAGLPIVTCEKGALAYDFTKLKPYLHQIGYSATIGGGSGMLALLRVTLQLRRIVGVVNASLNFFFSELQRGQTWRTIIAEAAQLGLCESASDWIMDLVRAELDDVRLKLTSLCNLSGVMERVLTPYDFRPTHLSGRELSVLEKRPGMRLVVSISREGLPGQLCWNFENNGWRAEARFVNLAEVPIVPFPNRQENALIVEDCAGLSKIWGLGAGPNTTAAAMISDAKHQLGCF